MAPLEEAEVEEEAMELVQGKAERLNAAQVANLKLALSTAQEDQRRALKLGEKAVAAKVDQHCLGSHNLSVFTRERKHPYTFLF